MKVDLQNSATVTKNYIIIAYEIISIHLIPSTKAILEIIFYCDNDKLYSRRYVLEDKEYTDWQSDDYLDVFLVNNIKKIFEN